MNKNSRALASGNVVGKTDAPVVASGCFYVLDFIPKAVLGICGLFDDAAAIDALVGVLRKISSRLKKPRTRPDTKPCQVSGNPTL